MAIATFVQSGELIDYVPGTNLNAGDVVVQGDLVGVMVRPTAAQTVGTLAVTGVFDFPKAGATVFAAGALVYWSADNWLAVASDGGGTNKLLGKAVQAAGAGTTTVRVRLSQ